MLLQHARRVMLARRARRFAALAVLASVLALALPAAACAGWTLVTQLHRPPHGFRLTGAQVVRIAMGVPAVGSEVHRHPDALRYVYTLGPGQWQVAWWAAGPHSKELAFADVQDATGAVTEAWTGYQIAWEMARGYPGAFGRVSNALYVWLPLCALFLAPFIPWRRLLDRRAWSLVHLDLVMLLGFSISLAFFNHADIGLSVPLVYPFLLYLLARLLALGSGRGRPRRELTPAWPERWLLLGAIVLVAFRVALNVIDSNVIDVGYAGVIGAHRLLHGHVLYGPWPSSNANGNTYGPVAYYAYMPFTAIFGWNGTWNSLPASHAAAIAFDLLTVAGLYLLGRRLRGPLLGSMLAYAWAAYPFTLFGLSSNSNDALVALLMVAALLAVASPVARGVAVGLAGMTKFAPLGLAPLFLRGVDGAGERGVEGSHSSRPPRRSRREAAIFVLSVAVTIALTMTPVLLEGSFTRFWQETISYQATRPAPFSIWGLWSGLRIEQHLVQGFAVALALAVAFRPKRRTLAQLAALGGAVLIAIQLGVTYWFYLYIVWFLPLALVALFAIEPCRPARAKEDGACADDVEVAVADVPGAKSHPARVPAPAR